MMRQFGRLRLHSFSQVNVQNLKVQNPLFTRLRVSLGLAVGFTYLAYRQGQDRYKDMHYAHMYETLPDTEMLTQQYFGDYKSKEGTFFQRFRLNIRRWLRGIYLFFKFTPLALTFPIAWLFKKHLFNYWLQFMLYTLQTAGPLWIKLGQWASHRGDIFGIEMTLALETLRDSSRAHQMKDTHKQFEAEFGRKIFEVFEFFNEKAVASGSIAQIYKARLNGQVVAVKVRHPNIIEELELDIKIWFNVAQVLGKFINQLAMPLTFEEFKRALVSQTDLRLEARNLMVFNKNFSKHPNVLFPVPVEPFVASSVLVETWEDGIQMTDFLKQKQTPDHLTLANLGLKTFYKMIIYDNFIHADCHAGNIFLRITPKRLKYDQLGALERIKYMIEDFQDRVFTLIEEAIEYSMNKWSESQLQKSDSTTQHFNLLDKERKSDENAFTRLLKSADGEANEVKIIFLDPGMVTILNKNDRASFIKLIMYITLRKPLECGDLMLQLAQYHEGGKSISEKTKAKFIDEIQDVFKAVCAVPLSQMNIGFVLQGIMEKLRSNDMAIEGHFAALLTNLIVLEGMVKELDPHINIVAKAASFLLHLKSIDKTMSEIIQQTL